MESDRPLILIDLDDTLFQTARKMADDVTRYPASHDINGVVSGYQTSVQKNLLKWLLLGADVVPVTARSAQAFSRVALDFSDSAICSHGGLILNPDRSVHQQWHSLMAARLGGYHDRLAELCEAALDIGSRHGLSLRGWVVEEAGQRHYVVVKHNNGKDGDLIFVLGELRSAGLLEGMHTHSNANNLALLPIGLSKQAAVEHYLMLDRELHGVRPVLGFGDSITDLGFMNLCHFWSTPFNSQIAGLTGELLGA